MTATKKIAPTKSVEYPLITSPRIKHLAGEGLKHPSLLTADQVRELCGSVMRHIERIT